MEKDSLKDIEYKILNPGGNKTAIVIGNQYNAKERKIINDSILEKHLDVEQVGFISTTENKLEMAGGEFCMNATRCAIWEYLNGESGNISIQVSGNKALITGGITESGEVYANIEIDKESKDILEKSENFNFVKLDGILHAVIDEEHSIQYIKKLKENEAQTKEELKEVMKEFKTEEKAVGIILLEEYNREIKINPIIWVKPVDTLYYETACGSGSLATAIYKNIENGETKFKILQPSGYYIKIELKKEEQYIKSATVFGKVFEEK